jgi:hypothetical protein
MYSQAVDGDAPSSLIDDSCLWFLERISLCSKTVGTGLMFFNKFVTQRAFVLQIIGPFVRVRC